MDRSLVALHWLRGALRGFFLTRAFKFALESSVSEPMIMPKLMNKYLAEALGTFVLVFAGTGAIIINQVSGGAITHIGIALSFGLAVLIMIYSVGEVSGAHLNPAVTLGFLFSGRLNSGLVVPYILSQCAGAFAASAILKFLFNSHQTLGTTLPAGAASQSFVLEIILTMFLMFAILSVSIGPKEKGITAGIVVGSTIALDAMFGGPISGASMNPARSLAPAVLSGNLKHLWIYLLAPVLGSLAAVLLYKSIHGTSHQEK